MSPRWEHRIHSCLMEHENEASGEESTNTDKGGLGFTAVVFMAAAAMVTPFLCICQSIHRQHSTDNI